jgi:hypothetical protein
VKIGMNVCIFNECSDPKQSVSPQEHDSNQRQSIQAKVKRIKTDVVLKLSRCFVVGVNYFANKRLIDAADDTNNTEQQAVELGLGDLYAELAKVDDKYEDRREETNRVDNGQRQVELRHGDGHTLDDHTAIPLDHVIKVDVVFEVQSHVVISPDQNVDNHQSKAPENRCLDRVYLVIVDV